MKQKPIKIPVPFEIAVRAALETPPEPKKKAKKKKPAK